ncbi:uncharacterized protein LOC119302078 [Triticum dicoccoides]|uniref:uncharacterized protein LOC119302078 n=1 Tax=Triticum dicoccoides TaxID=85692 RepID=UPI00189078A2|nr:uncharacterized protein LOC119302078 [Triticum dicoccoides]
MPSTPSMAPDPLNNASNSSYMLLRVLFFRLVLGLQVESSISMEIIAFWLWLQQGNGQVGYLQHIYSLGDNHFRAIVSSAKRFLEVLHFAFGGSEARSIARSDFQNQAIEGISLYLNTICYEALEDLRERIEMNFVRNKMTYLRQEAYGQSRTDQVPTASSMTDLYQEAYGESSHEQIPNISMTDLTKRPMENHRMNIFLIARNTFLPRSRLCMLTIRSIMEKAQVLEISVFKQVKCVMEKAQIQEISILKQVVCSTMIQRTKYMIISQPPIWSHCWIS